MGTSEFVGRENKDWDDDPDYFTPVVIQRQPTTPAIGLRVEGRYAKLTTAFPILSLTSDDLSLMIESLQEVKDFLDSH